MSNRHAVFLAGPEIMLFSAAIFGFFGFMTSFPEIDTATGDLIPLVVTLKWTLRASAIAFALCAGIAMSNRFSGNLAYSLIGLLSAGMLAIVGVWDLTSPFHTGISPILLFIFAAWNGFSSYAGLREVMAVAGAAKSPPTDEHGFNP